EATLLDGVHDGIPKSKSRMQARRTNFECTDCQATLDVSSLALAHVRFQLRLGGDAVEVEVSLPGARCTHRGKEEALPRRSRRVGGIHAQLPNAVDDRSTSASLARRSCVPVPV